MSSQDDMAPGEEQSEKGPWALFALAMACVAPPQARLTVVRDTPPAPLPLPDAPLLPEAPRPEAQVGVTPLRCALELRLDPRQETFLGLVEYELMLAEATTHLWLRGSGLTVHGASVSTRGARRPARVLKQGEDALGFLLERPVGPGPVTLRVAWQGTLSPGDAAGLHRHQEGGSWYARTRLSLGDARRVLPCLGDAGLRLPCQLTLRVRPEDRVFTELPVRSEEVGPDGLRTVRFQPTPEHLECLAFKVGPADTVVREALHTNSVPAKPRGSGRKPTA